MSALPVDVHGSGSFVAANNVYFQDSTLSMTVTNNIPALTSELSKCSYYANIQITPLYFGRALIGQTL